MDIIALKLVTGEELLGENVSAEDGRFLIKNPVGIQIVRGQDGRPNVGFAPFPLHSEDKSGKTVDIDGQHVVYSYDPAEDFVTNYNQIFGSGIVLPPTKSLITG
jgi:hypothetical protein